MIKKVVIGLVLFLIVALVGILFRPSLIISRAKAVAELRQEGSHFYTWHGAKIHYVDEGSGIPILMIHGFGGSHRNFEKIAKSMKSQYRIIRVDVPGFGLSEMPKGEKEMVALYRSFMTDFIRDMKLDSVYLVGNSMGGGLAWMATYDNPQKVKGMVLLAAAGYDLQRVKKSVVKIARFGFAPYLFRQGIPLFLTKKRLKRVFYNDDLINPEEAVKSNMFGNIEGNLESFFAMAHSNEFPEEAWIKEIKTPSLIIWGKQDEVLDVKFASRFKHDLSHSTLKIYDHCGHVPMVEKTEQTKTDIAAFISSVEHAKVTSAE